MPIYEYRCAECGQEEEFLQRMGASAPESGCTACGGALTRKFSRVAVRYEGWGFNATDSLVGRTDGKDFKALRERADRISDGGT